MKVNIEVDEDTDDVTYFAVESLKAQSNALVEADQTGSEAEIILTSFKADGSLENKQKGEEHMADKLTNVDMFTALKNQLDSGRLALTEVATSLGIDLMTSKQKTALKRLNDAESKVGDIAAFVDTVSTEKEAAFTSLKEAKLKDKFKTDELIEIAAPLFSLKTGSIEEIDAEVEKIAEFKVFKTIQGTLASAGEFTPGGNTDAVDNSSETMEA